MTTYTVLFFSLVLYLVPLLSNIMNTTSLLKAQNSFYIISCSEAILFLLTPVFVVLYLNSCFMLQDVTAWFGHIIFSSFQYKVTYFVSFMFILVLHLFSTSTYFSSNEVYDFVITKYNMYYWILFLFFSNSIFTAIFVIEVLSTLIFLLISTSIFSTTFFFKNISFDLKVFFKNDMPFVFLQSLLFFFWVSLVSSLNLFVFIILFYNNLLTFDYYLIEHVFSYLVNISSFNSVLFIGLTWFLIVFSIFLKCGIVPLFLWKPTFFKGLNFNVLIFYIVFFYFFLFLFFINFLSIYFSCLFYYYSFVTTLFIFLGLISLFFILCESFYVKTFFAISSILNSLLIFVSLVSLHSVDFMFFL